MNDQMKKILNERTWYLVDDLKTVESESGVYVLIFPDDRYYIGSTKNLNARLYTHISNLRANDKSTYRPARWYAEARKSLNLPTPPARQIPPPPPEPFYPGDLCDKLGHRIGKRCSKAALAKYEEELKQHKEEVKKWEYENRYLIGFWNSYYKRRNDIDFIVKTCGIKMVYSLCSNYSEVEDEILHKIKDLNLQDQWYNTQFYSNNFNKRIH